MRRRFDAYWWKNLLIFLLPFVLPTAHASRHTASIMMNLLSLPLTASISVWVRDVQNELTSYSNQMTTYHWGVVAGCAVAFGFLCLKGSGVNR